ncbi:diphthamide biosynthesis protein 3-like [Tamandua tetradactyla]|uniref:diphthamide biosynthesis protein 3-like n=1 Tax=Tamandua tetradactyla TaxID=48850 RepID=UPI004054757A
MAKIKSIALQAGTTKDRPMEAMLDNGDSTDSSGISRQDVDQELQCDEDNDMYFYPCLCGDNFSISKDWFMCGKTIPAPSTNKELVKC